MPQLTAVTPERFSEKAWTRPSNYTFAKQVNIIPIVGAELIKAVPAFPIGFVQAKGSFELVAITALQPGINLFVGPEGQWLGDYVPAMLRSYPFRLGKVEGLKDDVLCFIEDSGLLVDSALGEAFFEGAGMLCQSAKEMLDFVSKIENSREGTQLGVDTLGAAHLIQPWPLKTEINGKRVTVNGLFRIDEAALNQLDSEVLCRLRDKGALAIAYAQLFSMNQLSVLEKLKLMQEQLQAQSQAAQQAVGASDLNLEFLSNSGTISFGYLS